MLFIEDPAGWSAQVLEHDIATQADSLEALFHEVERILRSHLALARAKGRAPFADLPPAPEKYWDVFHKSQLAVRGAETRPINRPPSDITQDIRIAVQIAA